MKKAFSAITFALLLAALAMAQDATPPAGTPAAPDQQTPAASGQQPAETTPSQSPSQQLPDSQQGPPTQPTDRPAATGRQAPPENSGQNGTAQAGAPKIAPGSVIPAQLTKSIDAKKAKTGDQVVAKVTMDMKTQNGDVIVPKDTKIMGHVTEAQARTKEQKESQLGIAFDRAVIKGGSEISLPMSIQAIVGQQSTNANAPAANDQPTAAPTANSGPAASGGNSGMSPGRSGNSQAPPAAETGAADTQGSSRPAINGQTQGVVGISNLKLAPPASGSQGSVVTSEKNNVKLDSDMLLLLKVQ